MHIKKLIKLVVSGVSLTFSSSLLADNNNLVSNGSFEEHGSLNHGNWGTLTELPGWHLEEGHFEIQRGRVSGISAIDGQDKLELDANSNSSIYTWLPTTVDKSYILKFAYSPRVQRNGTNTNNVNVLWDGKKISDLSGGIKSWKHKSYIVKASSAFTKLKFVGAGNSDGRGGLIDDVQVIPLNDLTSNKIKNGSFEQHGELNHDQWGVLKNIPYWVVTKGWIEIQKNSVSGLSAIDGITKVELDSYKNSAIEQILNDLEKGKKYRLTLSYSPRISKHRNTNKIKITWNNRKIAVLDGETKGWKDYYFTIKAKSNNKLKFKAIGKSDGYGGLIDDIQLYCLDCGNTQDTDGDGILDTTDPDDDNDGILDAVDAFPLNPNESVDTDSDGIGNNADTDDDSDGYSDQIEITEGTDPLDSASKPADADGDGIPDTTDTDDDNDGVLDDVDAFPLDPNESIDTDSDGIGNNADTDDDGDGYSDQIEIAAGTDSLDANSKPVEADITAPVISINGSNVMLFQGTPYIDAGATALDDRDGNIEVVTTGAVDIDTIGTYTITYTATDAAGNLASATRNVEVIASDQKINVLSPASDSVIKYSYVTIQVEASVSDVKAQNISITDSLEQVGIKSGNTFLIYNVLLQKGENEIELSANGGSVITTLTLNSESEGFAPVFLALDQNKGFGNLVTNATVNHKTLTVTQYLIDVDGDKAIDIESNAATVELNFPAVGAYHPSVVVKTNDNILYASITHYNETINIINNPEPQSTSVSGISDNIHDLEEFGQHVYALTDTAVIKISKFDNTNVETINLTGFSSPRGLSLDNQGNIYIADTGAHRIVKLLASDDYQPDPDFALNASGSEVGQLLSPADVTVSNDEIFVLDAGNDRVQVFSYLGKYLTYFDGSTTPQGKLNKPLNMIGAPYVIITDSGNNSVREISYNRLSNTEKGSQLISLNNMGKVTYSSDGIIVPDNDSKQLLYLRNDGTLVNKLPMSQENQIALGYEQNHQLFYKPQNVSQLKHLFIDKTAPEVSPTALTQKFVQAYLGDNQKIMREITTQRWINRLKRQDAKARDAFTHMTSYSENIYMHGFKAVVFGKTQFTSGEVVIKFYFVWANGQWVLSKII